MERARNPFESYRPLYWKPGQGLPADENHKRESGLIYSFRRDHEISGKPSYHELSDRINRKKQDLEKVVLGYDIKGQIAPLFRAREIISSPYDFDHPHSPAIRGELGERISRRVVKYFLKHFTHDGKTYGNFGQFSDDFERDNFTIKRDKLWELKTGRYPRALILKESETGKYFGQELIKELDGLFFFHYAGQEHIIVVESKTGSPKLTLKERRKLKDDLFAPLKDLFPDSQFSYIMFSPKTDLYETVDINHKQIDRLPRRMRQEIQRRQSMRRLKAPAVDIYEDLSAIGVNTMFFTFNETEQEFGRMVGFLENTYHAILNDEVKLPGRMHYTSKSIKFYNGASTPRVQLDLNPVTGEYKLVKSALEHHKNIRPQAKELQETRDRKRKAKRARKGI